ncbi:MAG: Fmu (Sun) domain protein [Bacteroidetes bacterium]|nr:Fmu (Sun) domain protein [Bacteroidota bacterium]
MSAPHLLKQIILRKNEEHRIVGGHPWVFSNEIRDTRGSPAMGDVVELLTAGGLTLGIGIYNPHSLIAFRLLSGTIEEIDTDFFQSRITRALDLRRTLYPDSSTYRLVHGEGDFLPGLVIDRFNEFCVVQTVSHGMDLRLPMICDALESVLSPKGIVERNESPMRTLEQLPQKKGVLRGEAGKPTISLEGLLFQMDVLEGQKTGFFLDQRENRGAIARFSKNAEVLDCFCNDGGFSLSAARAGASSVTGLDSSEEAITNAMENARLNGLTAVRFEQADVFEALGALAKKGARFDLLVLDPPSFARSRKNVQTARKGYKELHTGAFRLLKKGGILATASCSHHIDPDVFLSIVDDTARKAERRIQLLEWRGAAPDHPTLPSVPETRYLKFGIFRLLD